MTYVGRVSWTSAIHAVRDAVLPKDEWARLDEEFGKRLLLLVCYLCNEGYGKVRIAEGRRTLEEQQRLWALGRSKDQLRRAGIPESMWRGSTTVVTWIKPEESKHVVGEAADLDTSDYGPEIYAALRSGCGLAGLQWGGLS